MKRRPFVFEVRDLWPQSIVAVGALKNNWIIRLLERMEHFLYENAQHIVAAVPGIRTDLIRRGFSPDKISLIPNGVDLDMFCPHSDIEALRTQYRLQNHFVVSYIGTHGMAHALDKVMLAADRLRDQKILFLFVGEGAEKEKLIRIKEEMGLDHVRFIDRQPRAKIPFFIAVSDVCLVSLSSTDFFSYALPSKLFEFMACGRPLILSTKGASRQLIEEAQCGIGVEPEQPEALAEAILKLHRDPILGTRLGRNGRQYVAAHMDRRKFALQYEQILEAVVSSA
jgi:glycosyltransferase involved in cell wall biosynthesis